MAVPLHAPRMARFASDRKAPAHCRAPPATASAAEEPTVTDANLVLGRLGADRFLGGEMKLNFDSAQRALAKVGAPARHGCDPGGRRHPGV